MNHLLRIASALVALLLPALPAAAAGESESERSTVRIEVHVTSLTTGEVWLDVGRSQGLEPGDRVRLEPLGAPSVEAVVLSVASDSARARIQGQADGVDIGTRGEARVPANRLETADEAGAAPSSAPQQSGASAPSTTPGPIVPAPEQAQGEPQAQEQQAPHPEWSAPPEEWNQDMPLLAAPQIGSDTEREVTWRGYAFADGQATFADGRDYSLARLGVDLEAENLFGQGGRLQIDVEAYARGAAFSNGESEDESSSRARIDRLSYLWGGDREHATSLEGGRFLQRLMPEFGVVDGFEWTHRFASGDRIGASFGFLPEWSPEMSTGDDMQVAAAWRHLAGSQDQLELGLGVQKTWHEGDADRDLAVGTLDWRPGPTWNVHGSAWVDVYGNDEAVKSSGAELTQANLNVSKRFSKAGLTLFGTRMLYPDLKRYEYEPVEPTTLDDFENTRLGASAWREIARKVRLSARCSFWMDDTDDGLTAELRLGVRDRILSQGEVSLALFGGDGKYGKVQGARLTASRSFAQGLWSLGLESALHEQQDFAGAQAELWQHVVRASYDRDLGEHWDVSLWGDQRFGDEQQATSVGVSLRRRF